MWAKRCIKWFFYILLEKKRSDFQLDGRIISNNVKIVIIFHYAPISASTADKINNSVYDTFNRKMGVA